MKPTYKPHWEIPGGIVELDESPREAARREIREEIGLELAAGRLALVGLDYMAAGGAKTEALMFVFSGGPLTQDEQAGLRVDGDEIGEFRFAPLEEAAAMLGGVLGSRVERCVRAGSFLYSEGVYPSESA